MDYLYELHNGNTVVRTTGRNQMQRYDVFKGEGWCDWAWQDIPRRNITFVGASDKSKVSAVGVSNWPKKYGPTIPASRDCVSCHRTRSVRLGAGVDASLLLRAGPTEAKLGIGGWIKCPEPKNQRPPVPQQRTPQQGAQGPPGPAGPPGRDADTAAIVASLKQWLSEHQESMRGPAGPPGPAGKDGKPGRDGKDGVTPAIDYDQLAVEVAKRLPATATKPIYIGAKDYTGRVTMEAVAVEPGDTVYIRVQPPSLTAASN